MTTACCPSCDQPLPPDSPGGLCPGCLLDDALRSNPSRFDRSAYAATSPGPDRNRPPEIAALSGAFSQLTIDALLGHGGMGAVYLARQTKLDRQVALKIIRPDAAADPAFAERFSREARMLARLDHPGIVRVYDFGETTASPGQPPTASPATAEQNAAEWTGAPSSGESSTPSPGETPADVPRTASTSAETLYYFVMEYVDGVNLRQLMLDGRLSPALTISIVQQICDALQYAHEAGIVHRDIKPENILIDSRGRVKLADFGLARLAVPTHDHFTLTATHQVMGTPRYMAPEQMEGSRTVNQRADIYSLGVVFYEMLTGRVPAGHFAPPSRHADIDSRLDAIVLRAMAHDPEQRFASVSELRADVDRLASGAAVQPVGVGAQEPPPGVSTIIDREAAAAWRLLAPAADARREPPRAPALLLTVLAACGFLMVFAPWLDVETVRTAAPPPPAPPLAASPDGSVPPPDTPPEPARALLSSARMSSAVQEEPQAERSPTHMVSYRGTDLWPGVTAAASLLCLVLLLVVLPHPGEPRPARALLMTVLSLVALVSTFLFHSVVGAHAAALPPEHPAEPSATLAAASGRGTSGYTMCLLQAGERPEPTPSTTTTRRTAQIRIRYGFVGSLCLSAALVLLNGLVVRQAIAARAGSGQPAGATDDPAMARQGWFGARTLAGMRFRTTRPASMTRLLKFHFEALGYTLAREGDEEWVFRRGRRLGGLLATSMQDIDTTLIVRCVPIRDRQIWISCEWRLVLLGAVYTRSEIRKLEGEGQALEELLRSDDLTPAAADDAAAESLQPSRTGETVSPTRARLSRRAVIAACLAPLGVLAWLPPITLVIFVLVVRDKDSPVPMVYGYIEGVIALVPTLLTTLLGVAAISDIRSSNGRLRGLGLATFAALLFPLMLGGLTVWGVLVAVAGWATGGDNPWHVLSILVATAVVAGLMFLIAVSVWRRVRTAADPTEVPAADRTPPPPAEPFDPARARLRQELTTAATCLKLSAILACLFWTVFTVALLIDAPPKHSISNPEIQILVAVAAALLLSVAGYTFRAASHLKAARRHDSCFAAAILALLPWGGAAWLVSLPVGVWIFHMLQRNNVRDLFAQVADTRR